MTYLTFWRNLCSIENKIISLIGTVWLQQLLSLIYFEEHRRGTGKLQTVDQVPFFEYNFRQLDFGKRPSPRLFSTHLPYNLVPSGLKNKKGKVGNRLWLLKDNCSFSWFHFVSLHQHCTHPTVHKYGYFQTLNFNSHLRSYLQYLICILHHFFSDYKRHYNQTFKKERIDMCAFNLLDRLY